ncbi:MAG: NAD(P)/FAD-dependent oxidoreductase [Alphaproteobacteria bacterium]|nr:NAD(P)/FAD-dependent oxidoreductase [Alphaproteobacteria bacterium]MBU2083331.1 NAD(P)/FAD-dependent oxidoreductase [Alphaproteobacteria bacterium]MBU2143704.1 NAD(P)/FAD-dependent oxidoreductase [Alphaproteobacteria bacterium]MBU2195615.1 NAD(P)/FAD-dependent oxidoreductase [Alphaproteobacteria bacterium]
MTNVDCIVIGAGAVGLACAAELARRGHETYVLEAARDIGTGTSSRNSEVIHAGLYYATGSLRHRMCVSGRRKLYAYLASHGVAHRRAGKMIVATDTDQVGKLESLLQQGRSNDVEGLTMLEAREAVALEPQLACAAALMSAETGLLDSHGYMTALRNELEDLGGAVLLDAPVLGITVLPDGQFSLRIGGRDPYEITTRYLVNSAGLYAHRLAREMEGYDTALLPGFTLAKGNYFSCQTRPAFSHLIYPVPVNGGLGVHVTLDLAGQMRFGPDVEWLGHDDPDRIDYRVDAARADDFYAAVRRYWPGLPDGAIVPDYAGCRPKLTGLHEPASDFRIDGPSLHGHEGLVHLFGIESPGLTSSLAIAEYVADCLNTPHASTQGAEL